MKRWWLEIVLNSDMCAATGDSEQGIANIKTAQEYGIPFIPAKRLKGCLLNEAREMVSNGLVKQSVLGRLFGESGRGMPGGLRVGDGRIYRIPDFLLNRETPLGYVEIEDYEGELKGIRNHPLLCEGLTERLLTGTRTRTAIEKDTGTAQSATLRTLQIVPRGIAFRGVLELADTAKEDEIELLGWCVKALRHIGLGITRGYGEVSCTLREIDCEKQTGEWPEIPNSPDEIQLSYEIELESPVLFAGDKGMYDDCCDYIPGAAVMGALAAMYIEDHGLGRNAHRDETFSRIFLRDGVRFGNGFLHREGRSFYPGPAFLVQEKRGEERLINRFDADNETVRRREINCQVHLDWRERKVYLADVEKEVRMHHARPVNRGMGHAENDRIQAGALDMGQFFSYTSITRGQRFSGTIRGTAKDLRALVQCLKKRDGQLYLGRSRTAEYGKTVMRLLPNCAKEQAERSNQWLLWLLSPLAFVDGEILAGQSELARWEAQLEEQLNCLVKVKDSILKYTRIGGYNGKWNLPLPQYTALAPGTAVHIETGRELDAAELEAKVWGDLTGRGCGQILALPWEHIHGQIKDYKKIAVEGGTEAADQEESEFIQALIQCRENEERLLAKRREAVSARGALPNMVTIQQLIALVERKETCTYEYLIGELEKIGDGDKREAAKQFLNPCKGKDREFIYYYLLNSKWSARREAGNHEKRGK